MPVLTLVPAAAIDSVSRRVVVGAFNGVVTVFDLGTGSVCHRFMHEGPVLSLDADWDGGLIAR